MTTTSTPIAQAVRLLRAAAKEIKDCHTRGDDDWSGEPEALAAHDEHLELAKTLEQLGETARAFPAMTQELEKILGTMCFQTISLSQILRAGGQEIEPRAEAEQAAVLHWMLSLWAVHGDEWRKAAVLEVERIREAPKETLECST